MKPSGEIFLEQTQSKGLGLDVKQQRRRPRGCPTRPKWVGTPSILVGPSSINRPTSSSYIYPRTLKTSRSTMKNLIPPLQPSVSARSHLGAFVSAPPEGESTIEGFYINTIASSMSCEQFPTDLRVHSYQLDGFFSLFESQYNVLLDFLGDLFDVTLFAVCLSRSDELWVYDQVYL